MNRHRIAVVLLHHPVTNRLGSLTTTAVTNMDIHDLSRTCRTYEVDHFYLVSPLEGQEGVVDRILAYWAGSKPESGILTGQRLSVEPAS